LKILLDENFPLQLYRRLIDAGHDAEHIIALGQRGLPDAAIRSRLAAEEHLVFLTQDSEFEQLASGTIATVIISRIPQAWLLRINHQESRAVDESSRRLRSQELGRKAVRTAGNRRGRCLQKLIMIVEP
jgi:predicted nuclease of predicted toxin-antitoxin system